MAGHAQGTPANIYDMTTKQRREGIAPPDLGEKFEQNPQFLEACAQVRYRARFADNAGSVVYLTDCEPPREELDAAELDEVAKLRGQPVSAVATIQQAATELSRQIDGATKRGADTLTVAGENLTKAGQQARADAEAGASTLGAAGDHVETKSQAAAQTLRRAQKELQPTLDELETNQVRLEAVVEEYKLKENPRQTRRALANNGVSKRIANLILEHLILGKPVPKAPTAARMLKIKYSTEHGLDRRTVHRQYQIARPILRAAGWPERLLPASKAAEASGGSKAGHKPHDDKPPNLPSQLPMS